MSIVKALLNRIRARARLARARRILDLERTRRRFQIIALVVAFWLCGAAMVLMELAGLIGR